MAVHGEFDLTATTPDGPRASHMSVDVDGGNITGTITADGQSAPITDGHITEAGEITFKVHVNEPAPTDLVFKAKCDDTACTTVTGTVAVPGVGEFPLKGKRA
eukprot:gene18917-19252_t